MKKLLVLLALIIISCAKDDFYEPIYVDTIPETLQIEDLVGIKLESNFATSEIRMNVKLNTEGDYFIKVIDISNKVIAKEKVNGELGDNLFKVYTSTLPKSSYRLELFNGNKKVGATNINLR